MSLRLVAEYLPPSPAAFIGAIISTEALSGSLLSLVQGAIVESTSLSAPVPSWNFIASTSSSSSLSGLLRGTQLIANIAVAAVLSGAVPPQNLSGELECLLELIGQIGFPPVERIVFTTAFQDIVSAVGDATTEASTAYQTIVVDNIIVHG